MKLLTIAKNITGLMRQIDDYKNNLSKWKNSTDEEKNNFFIEFYFFLINLSNTFIEMFNLIDDKSNPSQEVEEFLERICIWAESNKENLKDLISKHFYLEEEKSQLEKALMSKDKDELLNFGIQELSFFYYSSIKGEQLLATTQELEEELEREEENPLLKTTAVATYKDYARIFLQAILSSININNFDDDTQRRLQLEIEESKKILNAIFCNDPTFDKSHETELIKRLHIESLKIFYLILSTLRPKLSHENDNLLCSTWDFANEVFWHFRDQLTDEVNPVLPLPPNDEYKLPTDFFTNDLYLDINDNSLTLKENLIGKEILPHLIRRLLNHFETKKYISKDKRLSLLWAITSRRYPTFTPTYPIKLENIPANHAVHYVVSNLCSRPSNEKILDVLNRLFSPHKWEGMKDLDSSRVDKDIQEVVKKITK